MGAGCAGFGPPGDRSPQKHEFCRAWMRGFVAFIKPKGFTEAGLGETYLAKLDGSGKKSWQVAQAGEALRTVKPAEPG